MGRHSGTRWLALKRSVFICVCALVLALIAGAGGAGVAFGNDPNLEAFPNPSGAHRTFTARGSIDTNNPFFQSLGTNGRACASCHQPGDGWTITPPHVQARFDASGGLDPIFRTNDGSNSPDADVSTLSARRAAYSMLLTKGLIRVGIGLPANAEFSLQSLEDPYGYAKATEFSLFRRPLPSTNLAFLSAVMWDGRQTRPSLSMPDNLAKQANDATTGHAQGAPLSASQRNQIVAFETALYTAQTYDMVAGELRAQRATGGPNVLSTQPFYLGINDPFGGDPTGAAFNPVAIDIFDKWEDVNSSAPDPFTAPRLARARGETIFYSKPISLSGVTGLNDVLGQTTIAGTCTTCHNTPNVLNHSSLLLLNIGISDGARRTSDLPLYTLRRGKSGEIIQTTDPGRALITGRWDDIGKFKVPTLRGLPARSPYFHNGSAATLDEVVKFYDTRFAIGLTPAEKADLVAFLQGL
jgi:cytochrome c peroxidase